MSFYNYVTLRTQSHKLNSDQLLYCFVSFMKVQRQWRRIKVYSNNRWKYLRSSRRELNVSRVPMRNCRNQFPPLLPYLLTETRLDVMIRSSVAVKYSGTYRVEVWPRSTERPHQSKAMSGTKYVGTPLSLQSKLIIT